MFPFIGTFKQLSLFTNRLQCRNVSTVALSFFKVANVNVDSSRAPLFIYHGLFGSKANWKSISNQLANRTKRVVYAFDLRNHGESPHVDGSLSGLDAMASDIGHFMETTQIDKICLLGHSLGGRVASQFAFHSPDKIEKLILVDVSPLNKLPKIDFLDDSLFNDIKESIQRLAPNIDLRGARTQVGSDLIKKIKNKFIVDFFLLSLYKDKDNMIKWRFNVDALKILVENRLIDKIDIRQPFNGPTLVIHGQNSSYVPTEDYSKIKEVLPFAQFVCIPNAGHYLHIEKPNEFIGHVVEFVQ